MSRLAYRGPVSAYTTTNQGSPQPGGPFSALDPSMQPAVPEREEMNSLNTDPNAQPDFTWDEFGFRVEEEDGPEDISSKLLSLPFLESPRRRLQWAVELELGQGGCEEVRGRARLKVMMEEEGGIPHSLRPQLWPRLLAAQAKRDGAEVAYREVVVQSGNMKTPTNLQIEKDLLRTLPSNICFSRLNSVGIPRLRRVLRAVAHHKPEVGYCQGWFNLN